MSLQTVEAAVRNGFETVIGDISSKVTEMRPHLEELASLAERADQSPLVKAALSAVLTPEQEQVLAQIITTFANAVGVPATPAG